MFVVEIEWSVQFLADCFQPPLLLQSTLFNALVENGKAAAANVGSILLTVKMIVWETRMG